MEESGFVALDREIEQFRDGLRPPAGTVQLPLETPGFLPLNYDSFRPSQATLDAARALLRAAAHGNHAFQTARDAYRTTALGEPLLDASNGMHLPLPAVPPTLSPRQMQDPLLLADYRQLVRYLGQLAAGQPATLPPAATFCGGPYQHYWRYLRARGALARHDWAAVSREVGAGSRAGPPVLEAMLAHISILAGHATNQPVPSAEAQENLRALADAGVLNPSSRSTLHALHAYHGGPLQAELGEDSPAANFVLTLHSGAPSLLAVLRAMLQHFGVLR